MTYSINGAWIHLGFFSCLCGLCVAIVAIDIRERIIPNWLNFAVASLGLIQALTEDGNAWLTALAHGALAAAAIALLRHFYFRVRSIEGLGMGDVKFFGAAGIWIGLSGLPILILIATGSALAVVAAQHLAGHAIDAKTSLPFGPFLALGLLVTVGLAMWN
jgi:leader peptidase (prepilin peptidase)/N-methyltransferase